MSTDTTDRIERETSIAAPVERVWALPTDAERLGAWFGVETRLRVVETGFASLDLPAEEQAKRADGNTDGWAHEMRDLGEYARSAGAAARR